MVLSIVISLINMNNLNRLTASDDNGFVTSYWYDAGGERTVKTSGENAAMFVNSEFAGGMTNTAKFSLYVSYPTT